MPTGCGPDPQVRCWATGSLRRPRGARSCARSPGARPASSTTSPAGLGPRLAGWRRAGTVAVDHRHRLDPLPDLWASQAGRQRGVDRHGERGYHPLLASVAEIGDVLHSRLREGVANSGRGRAASWPSRPAGRAGPGRPGRSAYGPARASTTTRLTLRPCRPRGPARCRRPAPMPAVGRPVPPAPASGWWRVGRGGHRRPLPAPAI